MSEEWGGNGSASVCAQARGSKVCVSERERVSNPARCVCMCA